MRLTIAIPTLDTRLHFLKNCLGDIYRQIAAEGAGEEVEVDVYADRRERSVGYKRNRLLQRARGEFVCFVDDDDKLDRLYIKRIIGALREFPHVDCLGLTGSMHDVQSRKRTTFIHSIQYDSYFKGPDGVLYRPPNHLNPIRTAIARDFEFPDLSFGEDTDWAMRICRSQRLKTEHFLGMKTLYYYEYVHRKSH